MTIRILCSVAGFASAIFVAGSAGAGELVPHRATYAMYLAKTTESAAISDARGAMVYEFRDTCDGWSADSRIYLRLRLAGGPEFENVRTMHTWESKDGEAFRFRLNERQDDDRPKEIRGVAISDAESGTVEYTQPRPDTEELPKGTVFPTAHLRELIAFAEAGTPHLARTMFDGATLKNPFVVSAVIGGEPELSAKVMGDAEMLEGVPRWRARLAYYPVQGGAETPEFQINVNFGADGIVHVLDQDFGDYVIRAALNEVSRLPLVTC